MTHWTVNKKMPFKAWVLLPSFRLKEVEIVAADARYSGIWFESSTGKDYPCDDLHKTRELAIARGCSYVNERIASLKKQLELQEKRRANLEKEALK